MVPAPANTDTPRSTSTFRLEERAPAGLGSTLIFRPARPKTLQARVALSGLWGVYGRRSFMSSGGVRIVAAVEAGKGALVLAAGLELFALVHRDVQAVAERIVEHFHFNPASRYPRI